MKAIKFTATAVAIFCSLLGKAQQVIIDNQNFTSVPTTPVGISQLQAETRLITQNSFSVTSGSQLTGSFASNARWNSMGNLTATTQILNGFRAQTDGRSLVWGHRIPNATGIVENPFIQWGGNNAASVTPGNLEFRSFTDPAGANAIHRLSLRENGTSLFGLIVPATSPNNPWVEIINENANAGSSVVGAKSTARNGLDENVGVYGLALGNTSPGPDFNYGVRGESIGVNSFGVYGQSNGFNVFSVGVYGVAFGRNSFAGFFDGDVFASGVYLGSDSKLKKNIQKVTNSLNKISQLNPVNYDYDKEKIDYLNLPEGRQNGFIAQEVEKIFPELVKEINKPKNTSKPNGEKVAYKSVNYIALIPILTKALQELNNKVDSLTEILNGKQAQTFVLNQASSFTANDEAIKNTAYSLNQNVPNPFSNTTTIQYTIPATATNASIAILNLNGTMVQQFNNLKGKGSITVNGNSLQAGIYLYSLISNGQEIITKRMVLAK